MSTDPSSDFYRLPRGIVALFALTAGLAAANIWYVQPLLSAIGHDFGVSDATAGLLVAGTQLGYLVGIAFLVPLGDLHERRRLISRLLALGALAAATCALAPGFAVLAAAMAALGVLSVVAQITVPLASSLAGELERGQVVGTVMSGLLIGVLSARVVSGLVAELAGWRGVYVLAAVLLVALALLLRRALPLAPPPLPEAGYAATLRSVFTLIREEAVLRQRMAISALSLCTFSMFWTAVTFLLSDPPYGYSEAVIGLFGIAGIAGAVIAPVSGRLADRGHARLALTALLLLAASSWGLLALGSSSVIALLVGIVVFDLAIQGANTNHQAAIYGLQPQARSRITSAFVGTGFLGMALGSILASLLYDAGGWGEVCAVAGGLAATTLVIWGATQRIGRGTGAAGPLAELDSTPG